MHPGVSTEQDYRDAQLKAIVKGRQKYPNLEWPSPWRYAGAPPPVYVSGGMWQIRCVTPGCGNRPSASPEWRMALCWDCSAVYENLVFPETITEIEQLLVARPLLSTRNWLPHETVADLERENAENGIVVAEVA